MRIDPRWLTALQADLALTEVRDCPDEPWIRRALAGASVGVDFHDAYVSASELVTIAEGLSVGDEDAQRSLALVLGSPGNDYQRCLWYNCAGRNPLVVLDSLRWLEATLKRRLDFAEANMAAERSVKIDANPYFSDAADGPLGVFSFKFPVNPSWTFLADAARPR